MRKALSRELRQCIEDLQQISEILAQLDLYSSFAQLSLDRAYTRPDIFNNNSNILQIENGRHPTVEKSNLFSATTCFIPNNCLMDESQRSIVITGANMSGKSTYIRMCAILTIMAQAGLYVPASKMTASVVDQIFSRVGSTDLIAKDQSTFMVEMNECSYILNNATKKSLVIMDEIGRGTSPSEGLSIALAVIKYFHNYIQCRFLFATHFFECAKLVEQLNCGANYYVDTEVNPNSTQALIFKHKVKKGYVTHSHGIFIAKIAKFPTKVVDNASIYFLDIVNKT